MSSESENKTSAPTVLAPVSRVFSQARWIFLKELSSFMGSNLPALVIGIVAFLCGLVSVILALTPGATYDDVAQVLFHAFYVFLLIGGIMLSMTAFVSERRQGTLELLYTLPVTDLELVLGKFMMGLVLVPALALGMTLVYVVGIAEAPWYIALAGFTGLVLAGLYAYSLGIFASSLSESYLVSLLVGLAMIVVVDIGGFLAGLLPEPGKSILTHLHGLNHFLPFTRGIIPLKGVVFFVSLIVLFLFLTVRVLESRRWRGQGN